MLSVQIDHETKDWLRNAADERAAANGCRFDESRGRFVVDWIERYCKLYEGDWAGQPMKLLDWFRDATLRLFGWVRHSDKWGREIRRFRTASVWVAKKNAKSPGLAAWGLYLLCGDGEPGQKVFLAAKDGTQARDIAGKHAVEMLMQSPELQAECSLNKNRLQITHMPSRSLMVPLSSSDSRTKQAKEGINGSILVDEVHVVDRDFMRRISRAGISRSEPLQIEVSTAGNNPDGYGKERFDYALAVEKGEFEDQELFTAIYAAPQDLTDTDLEADPDRYGHMANPAWGHTVDPEEYRKDYQTSKRSLQKLLDFKMYRLNIWQRSANPWFRAGDWERCRKDFTEADLAGRECWAGLDLSRSRDMCALVLCFHGDEEGEILLLPYFWLPEERAKEIDHLVTMKAWALAGYLELTPGGVTDYGFIRSEFRRLAKLFKIRELAYDPRFAEETTQALADGVLDDKGEVIEEGTGVQRFLFMQNDQNFAAPTEDFERLVIAGKLRHNGHPVLGWQIGHAMVRIGWNKVKRIFKQTKDSHQTVDGVVAGIMALARAELAGGGSVYDARGIAAVGADEKTESQGVVTIAEDDW